jgi:hypothetical protein
VKRAVLMTMLAAPCLMASAGEPTTVANTVVLTKQLNDLGAQVFWTRRTDYCSLQIMMTPPAASGRLPAVKGSPLRKAQAIQVWMLRADGTVIAPLRMTDPILRQAGGFAVEYNYVFALSANEEAIAVALMLDGQYTIQRLTPLAAK